jgi:hypothetical protein
MAPVYLTSIILFSQIIKLGPESGARNIVIIAPV